MSALRALHPHTLAAACAALGWPWEVIGALLMDPDGHALACEAAHDIAFELAGRPIDTAAPARARAILSEFGLSHDPADLPRSPEEALIRLDGSAPCEPPTEAALVSGFLAHARELLTNGCPADRLVERLVGPFADDLTLPIASIERAAAIALTDPTRCA